MGLSTWFTDFCSNLIVKNVGTISTRYKNITKRLNIDYWSTTSDTSHSLYVGSYGRGTAVQGFSDLDMIFHLPYSEYEKYNSYQTNGQSALLQAVKKSIEKTYSRTSIKGDGQIISVPFDDGITFEVVPGFINKDDSYTFPNANNGGSWCTTNPKPEISAIKSRNKICNGNLIQLCRMARAWKKKWDIPISGLLIDTLAYNFIRGYEYRDKSYLYYDFMSRDFFEYLRTQPTDKQYWLSPGANQYVWRKGAFEYKALRCKNIAVEACSYQSDKYGWTARQKWREIYGTEFPA